MQQTNSQTNASAATTAQLNFRANLQLSSRKEAAEAQALIEVLERSMPVKFSLRCGWQKKEVSFLCDGPETAKMIRARYFRNAGISWNTTPEERSAGMINVPAIPTITLEDKLQNALASLAKAQERLSRSGDQITFALVNDAALYIQEAKRKHESLHGNE